ncbi:phospholipid-transporting ATPase ABCA3-like [Drosophila tropicalis]|uniref:phospholipid-transporting ATPase ABCA3-like n=1 Tax=Drosophila tropicalis TaxID=46794 RepID=UPI0035ABD5F7
MVVLSLMGLPILMIMRVFATPEVQKKILYDTIEIDSLSKMHEELARVQNYTSITIVEKVVFTPNLKPFEEIMALAAKRLQLKDGYQGCESEDEVVRLIKYEGIFAGVVFRDDEAPNTTVTDLPNTLDYVLRFSPFLMTSENKDKKDIWVTQDLYPPFGELLNRGPRQSERNTNYDGIPPGYIQEGFIPLQHAIAMSFIVLKTDDVSEIFPQINMMKFPYRQYIYDKVFVAIKLWLPIVFLLAYVVPSYFMVRTKCDEFDRSFMKTFKINHINWWAWAAVLMGVQVFITILILIMLDAEWYGGAIIHCSQWTAVIFFLLCYIWANCAFVLMLSVVIIRKRSNVKFGIILHLLTYLPFPLIFIFYFDIPLGYKMLCALFLNTGLAMGINIISNLEHTNEGLKWNNYNRPLFASDGLSMLHVNEMLLLSSFLCIGITLYVDNLYSPDVSAVNLDKESMSKKFYYPLTNIIHFIGRLWRKTQKRPSVLKRLGNSLLRALTTHEDDLYNDQERQQDEGPSTSNENRSLNTVGTTNRNTSNDPDINVYREKSAFLSQASGPSPPKRRIRKQVLTGRVVASSSSSIGEYTQKPLRSNAIMSSVQLSIDNDHLPFQHTLNESLEDLKNGIQVINVSKVVGNTTYLQNINMTIHSKEITVFLIRNKSAGRLLLSKIIAGIIKPTSGKVIVNDIDIHQPKDMDTSRLITMVPSQSIVMNELTVCENFYFYLNLRGVRSSGQIDREISKYIHLMHGEVSMLNEFAEFLSENMARRLNLCCALCGGKHGIIVDEPTMGFDQNNRHYIWDLLKLEARSRTIIVNTAYSDEAEILGDRIALINCGQLMCYGPTKELINKFCSDYVLVCEKSTTTKLNWISLQKLIYHHIPNGAKILPDTGNNIKISIPNDHGSQLAGILNDLEHYGSDNGIQKFWVKLKSLRQVFHCSLTENKEHVENLRRVKLLSEATFDESTIETNSDDRTRQTFKALIAKRLIYMQHYFWAPLLLMIIMVICMCLENPSTHLEHLPSMNISIHSYPNSIALMKVSSDVQHLSNSFGIARGYEDYQEILINARNTEDHTFKIIRGRRELLQYLLFQQLVSEMNVKTFYVAAVRISAQVITCFWNNKLLHSAPISLNLVHNALAQYFIGIDAEIRVENHPVPFKNSDMLDLINTRRRMHMGLGSVMICIICLALIIMIVPLISDHNLGTGHLMYMGGASPNFYWITQFICDMGLYAAGIVYFIIILFVYDHFVKYEETEYDDPVLIILIIAVFILFGLSVIPFIYLFTVIFGQFVYDWSGTMLILLGSTVLLLLVIPCIIIEIEHVVDLYYLFCWSPSINLKRALKYLHIQRALIRACDIIGGCAEYPDCCDMPGYLGREYPGIQVPIAMLIVLSLVYSSIFILLLQIDLEWRRWRSIKRERSEDKKLKKKKRNKIEHIPLDEDVLQEKERVNSLSKEEMKQKPLVLTGVSKRNKSPFYLTDVTFAVEPHDIFGLVGILGSGKSEIIKLATGISSIDRGDIYINGTSVRHNQNITRKMISYCPRNNVLIESMTVSENLHFYCAMHGRKAEFVADIIREVTYNLGLELKLQKLVKDLSYTTRRKIMLAIIVTSNAKIVLMDEPTRGLDADSRLQVWRIINLLRDRGRTIILATDSMDECIALCSRIGIMVNGSLISIGSVNHLTSKFSKGSILQIRVPGSTSLKSLTSSTEDSSSLSHASHLGYPSVSSHVSVQQIYQINTWKLQDSTSSGQALWLARCQRYRDIKRFLQAELPQAKLKEEYRNVLTYYISFKSMPLSKVFMAMEAAKDVFNLDSYRITRTSLVDIFDRYVKSHVHFWIKEDTEKQNPANKTSAFLARSESLFSK